MYWINDVAVRPVIIGVIYVTVKYKVRESVDYRPFLHISIGAYLDEAIYDGLFEMRKDVLEK